MPAKFRKGIDLTGQRAIGAADASSATDLVTLQQMQAAIRGLDWKDSVRAASTGNLTLTAPGASIDGVTMATGDRFLAKNQTAAAENGIYVWNGAAVAAARAADADVSAEVTSGMATTVTEGTNKGTGSAQGNAISWILITNNPITLGTTALTFAQLGGSGGTAYTASATGGLDLTANAFSVRVPASSGLIVDATGVRIDPAIVSKNQLFSSLVTTNPQTFTHNLNKLPNVDVVDATGNVVYPDVQITTTTVVVDWGAAPTAGEYRVIVTG